MAGQRLVAGVDGAPGGWVVAVARVPPVPSGGYRAAPAGSDGDDRFEGHGALDVVDVRGEHSLDAVLDDVAAGRLCVVCVDMPIGLPATGRRPCEASARAALGPRRSSVFWSPPRAVLDLLDDYPAANLRCRELSGAGLSRQAFGLLPKVAELDAALDRLRPGDLERVWEGHPELAVARVLGHPARFPKRTAAGVAERLAALGTLGVDWARWLAHPPLGGGDDVIDALFLCDTAGRIASGRTPTVHGDGSTDERGRPQRIVG